MSTNDKANKSAIILSPEKINEGLYNEAMGLTNDFKITREEAFDFLAGIPSTQTVALSGGEYLKWDTWKPGTYVFIFKGRTSWIDENGQEVKAVQLEDREGNEYVCAATILYKACSRLIQMPCFIRVTYNGMEDRGKGKKMVKLDVEAFKGTTPEPVRQQQKSQESASGTSGNDKDLPF